MKWPFDYAYFLTQMAFKTESASRRASSWERLGLRRAIQKRAHFYATSRLWRSTPIIKYGKHSPLEGVCMIGLAHIRGKAVVGLYGRPAGCSLVMHLASRGGPGELQARQRTRCVRIPAAARANSQQEPRLPGETAPAQTPPHSPQRRQTSCAVTPRLLKAPPRMRCLTLRERACSHYKRCERTVAKNAPRRERSWISLRKSLKPKAWPRGFTDEINVRTAAATDLAYACVACYSAIGKGIGGRRTGEWRGANSLMLNER